MGIVLKNRQMGQGSFVTTESMKMMSDLLFKKITVIAKKRDQEVFEAIEKGCTPEELILFRADRLWAKDKFIIEVTHAPITFLGVKRI